MFLKSSLELTYPSSYYRNSLLYSTTKQYRLSHLHLPIKTQAILTGYLSPSFHWNSFYQVYHDQYLTKANGPLFGLQLCKLRMLFSESVTSLSCLLSLPPYQILSVLQTSTELPQPCSLATFSPKALVCTDESQPYSPQLTSFSWTPLISNCHWTAPPGCLTDISNFNKSKPWTLFLCTLRSVVRKQPLHPNSSSQNPSNSDPFSFHHTHKPSSVLSNCPPESKPSPLA